MKTKILTTLAALALAGSAWADTTLFTSAFQGNTGAYVFATTADNTHGNATLAINDWTTAAAVTSISGLTAISTTSGGFAVTQNGTATYANNNCVYISRNLNLDGSTCQRGFSFTFTVNTNFNLSTLTVVARHSNNAGTQAQANASDLHYSISGGTLGAALSGYTREAYSASITGYTTIPFSLGNATIGAGTYTVQVYMSNLSANGAYASYQGITLAGNPTNLTLAPVFSPAAGTYLDGQTVTISSATAGATIYYTTNGTTPTTSSPNGITPVTVTLPADTNTTIQAYATKTGNTDSSVQSAAYSTYASSDLLADSFSGTPSGDLNLNDDLATRQSGPLAPMTWTGANSTSTQVGNPTPTNLLVAFGASAYLNTDFAPTVNGLNLPMTVSFLGTMQTDNNDGGNWFAVMVSSAIGQYVNGGSAEYGILFRENGLSQIFNNGNAIAAPFYGTQNYGAGFALNQFIPITLVFSDSSGTASPFNNNGSMVVAYANGVPFSTNNISQMTSGYIGFCSPGSVIDNYAALHVGVLLPGGALALTANLPNTAYVGQNVLFSVTATGSSLSYQWYSNSVPVLGATNATLQLTDITTNAAANYSVTVSRAVSSLSTNVNLTVITPTPGTYEADVLALGPQVYLRYTDIASTPDVFNEGVLGTVANGLAEGSSGISYYAASGPQSPTYPNFEANNTGIGLDGSSGDVVIPPLNLSTNVGNTITMSAWIYSLAEQNSYAGVLFERGGDGSSGLQIQNDANGNNILSYDWATGNRWAFSSGLIIPNNQWCFVALVITPSSATIYLQDGTGMKTAVDTYPEGLCTFAGTTHVGLDPAVSTRRFSGTIDETAIFSRSLSPTEVNSLYASAVGAPPEVVADPVGVTNYTGQPFVLSPVISGAPPLSYQWYQDNNPISGATNNNYSVASAATANSGSYYLHVSNTAGFTNTDPVTVSITTSAPFFTVLPQGATVWAGVPITLSSAVEGSFPITYQWLANNVPLAGQTNASLTITDPEATTSYVLQATNSYGSTNSPAAVLTVQNPALSDQILYSTNGASFGLAVGINNDPGNPALFDYIGDFFTTGAKARQVTHLGYWDDSGTGTSAGHDVGLFQGTNLVASVYVPAGSSPFAAYGWRWVPLAHPVTLLPNTTYAIFGDTNGLDSWPNAFMPTWNTAYVGNNAASTYLSWSYDPAPFAFPQYPTSANLVGNQGWNAGSALGNVNLGSFPMVLSAHQITWTLGTLESATSVAGPYTAVPGATSPYTMPLTGPTMFYRVQLQ